MTRRLVQLVAVFCALQASIWASSPGPGDCKAVCEWQEYECGQGGGGWQQNCDDLDAYYDFVNDICDLDAFCIY